MSHQHARHTALFFPLSFLRKVADNSCFKLHVCLAPNRWEAELKHPDIWPTVVSQGGRLIPHTVLDVDLLGTLSVDDDRILNLDASIAKPPSLVSNPARWRASEPPMANMIVLPSAIDHRSCLSSRLKVLRS